MCHTHAPHGCTNNHHKRASGYSPMSISWQLDSDSFGVTSRLRDHCTAINFAIVKRKVPVATTDNSLDYNDLDERASTQISCHNAMLQTYCTRRIALC